MVNWVPRFGREVRKGKGVRTLGRRFGQGERARRTGHARGTAGGDGKAERIAQGGWGDGRSF